MTKFIISGGTPAIASLLNPTVLLHIPFAIHNKELFPLLRKELITRLPNECEVITPRQGEDLTEYLKIADTIYVDGGNGDLLFYLLQNTKDFAKKVEGKTCSGYSAGANVWSKHYYSNDNQAIITGFGVNSKMTFCHYRNSKISALKQLILFKPELEVITLGDNEYQEFYEVS